VAADRVTKAEPAVAPDRGGQKVSRVHCLTSRRSEGDDALLNHKLTADEQRVFKVFDSATAKLAKDAEQSEYHQTVAALGKQFGLTEEQSIAFWTRTTFSMFEV
jgi:hypothetical protein